MRTPRPILLTTANPPIQYTSADGITWTPTSVALPQGFDWTIVQEGPSSYRLYYAEILPPAAGQGPPQPCAPGSKRLRYATSTDLMSWTIQPAVLLDDVGCGVPHVMKTREGKYFLYYNRKDPVHGVYVGTSTDGLSWTIGNAMVANDPELVDPAHPDAGRYLLDGWFHRRDRRHSRSCSCSFDRCNHLDEALSRPVFPCRGSGVLDPSIEIIDGQLRVWFGYAPGGSHSVSKIANGIIRLGTAKIAKGKKCAAKGPSPGR
jgi:hypothetical protein